MAIFGSPRRVGSSRSLGRFVSWLDFIRRRLPILHRLRQTLRSDISLPRFPFSPPANKLGNETDRSRAWHAFGRDARFDQRRPRHWWLGRGNLPCSPNVVVLSVCCPGAITRHAQ